MIGTAAETEIERGIGTGTERGIEKGTARGIGTETEEMILLVPQAQALLTLVCLTRMEALVMAVMAGGVRADTTGDPVAVKVEIQAATTVVDQAITEPLPLRPPAAMEVVRAATTEVPVATTAVARVMAEEGDSEEAEERAAIECLVWGTIYEDLIGKL